MSEHVDELIARARDGELSFTERRLLDAHLATCVRCATLARQLERNDALLAKPERPITLQPFDGLMHRRPVRGGLVVALAAAAVAVVVLSGVFAGFPPREVAKPSDHPGPSAVASPTSTVTQSPKPPTPAPTVSPALPAFVGEPESITGVSANPLGSLNGNWIFVAKRVPPAAGSNPESLQVWAVPLDGRPPRMAFSYRSSSAGIPEAIFDTVPYLRRQFSPDGTQIVVSVNAQLIVVDLPGGKARRLGVDGYFPSWSKDGSQIAFLTEAPFAGVVPAEDQINVVAATGGTVRVVAKVHYARVGAEWSPDGTMLIIDEGEDGIAIVNAADGRVVRRLTGRFASSGIAGSSAYWRQAGAQIALTTWRLDDTQVLVLDDVTATERVVAQVARPHDPSPCQCPTGAVPADPRWNPAIPNELLYSTHQGIGAAPETHIVDVRSGANTKLPFTATDATWTWDGKQVAYLVESATRPQTGTALRLYDRASAAERELLVQGGPLEALVAIASVAY